MSTGVPTATITQADEGKGVFETCGQRDGVVDPKALGTKDVIERLPPSLSGEENLKMSLAEPLPWVRAQAES